MSGVLLKVLNMSIAGGVVILAVLLARLLLKRAPKWTRLMLWGIVGLRLALPFFPEASFSLMPRAGEVSPVTAVVSTEAPAVTQGPAVTQAPVVTQRPTVTQNPTATRMPAFTNAPIVTTAPITGTTETQEPVKRSFDWLAFAGYAWAAGAVIMLAYALISRAVLGRRLSTAVRLEGNVYEAEAAKTPFLLGLFAPRIYIPFGMDARSREIVLMHERAHMKALDHVLKPLGWVILAAHWFNPLAWLAYALFSKDIELNCDERVIRGLDGEARAEYSQTLLNLSVNRRRIAACPLAFGESNVKERVKNVLNYKKPAFWIMIASVLVTVFITGCFLTSPKKNTEPEKTFATAEETVEYAKEQGWVAVGPDYAFICGESVWNDFVHDVNEKKASEVTVVTVSAGSVLAESDREAFGGESVHSVQINRVEFDGKKFNVRRRYANAEEFDIDREYKYLDRFSLDDEYTYALMDGPLDEITRTDRALMLSGEVYPLFTIIPTPVFADKEAAYAYAENNGWVAVNDDCEFVCGEEIWNGFVRAAEAKEPASVTVFCPEIPDPSKDAVTEWHFIYRIFFDGEVFSLKYKLMDAEEFFEQKEFSRLEKLWVDIDGRDCWEYALVPETWFDIRSSLWLVQEREGLFPLFIVKRDEGGKLSELTREDIIAFLEENHICVEQVYREESFDLIGIIKALESAPIVDIEGMTYYQEYDLRYAIGLFDGSVERPEKPILSHMGEEELMSILSEYSVEVPEGADFDFVRYDLITLENDVNKEYWSDVYFDDQYMLFEQLRWVVVQYYEKTGILISDYRSRWNDYRSAFLTYLATGNDDWAVPGFNAASGIEVTVSHEDGAFCAWERCRTYIEKLGTEDYTYEYEGLLAEYPAELWDVCAEKLSNYHNEYLHWGWLPGQPYIGPYPDALICGEDSFLVVTEPWQDRQANLIMHRFADGEWREFGNSNMEDYPYIPTGFCITDDNTCFVCYKNRYDYVSSEGPHYANWVNFWASYDGGNTWECLNLELPVEYKAGYPYPMAYSPVFDGERGVLPVIANNGEDRFFTWFLTEDGGHTWHFGGERKVTNLSEMNAEERGRLIDEAWVYAQEAAEKHGVELLKETCRVNRYNGLPLTVSFSDAGYHLTFEAWFDYDAETGEYRTSMDNCWLFIEAPEDIDGEKFRSDNDEVRPGGDNFREYVPEGGNVQRYQDAAEAIACLIAERFTGCAEDNYLRCENAFVAKVESLSPDEPTTFKVCIVLDPVNEWFSGAFAGCMGPLYGDPEHPEWRGWYTLRFFLEISHDDGGYTAEISWY